MRRSYLPGLLLPTVALAAGLAACTAAPVVDDRTRALVGPVEAGRTTRQQIEARYGAPIDTFEHDRIAAWLLVERDDEMRSALYPDHRGGFNLMIEFGDDDTVERHAIIAVR